jgi:hypothetical protein
MGLPWAAWRLSASAFDASSGVNVSACGEPILFRRGGSYVTVITGPPRADVSNTTTRDAGVRARAVLTRQATTLTA